MSFVTRRRVRFAHVDAAAIVFYPRYFEMLNAAVEDYFADGVGVDFATMHGARGIGVPTVRLEADFVAVSRLGDLLDFRLTAERIGERSVTLAVSVFSEEELRFRAEVVLVCMNLDRGRAVPWPADIRRGLEDGAGRGAAERPA